MAESVSVKNKYKDWKPNERHRTFPPTDPHDFERVTQALDKLDGSGCPAPWLKTYTLSEAEEIAERAKPYIDLLKTSLEQFGEGRDFNDLARNAVDILIQANQKSSENYVLKRQGDVAMQEAYIIMLERIFGDRMIASYYKRNPLPFELRKYTSTASNYLLWETIGNTYLNGLDNPFRYMFEIYELGVNDFSFDEENPEEFAGIIKLNPGEKNKSLRFTL